MSAPTTDSLLRNCGFLDVSLQLKGFAWICPASSEVVPLSRLFCRLHLLLCSNDALLSGRHIQGIRKELHNNSSSQSLMILFISLRTSSSIGRGACVESISLTFAFALSTSEPGVEGKMKVSEPFRSHISRLK